MKFTLLFVLALIGGIIVLLVGGERLIDIMISGSYTSGAHTEIGLEATLEVGFGMVCGLLMVVGSIMLFKKPQQHRMWGLIVLAFSMLSIVGTAGGIFIGLLLGLIGGIYGIIWKPSIPPS